LRNTGLRGLSNNTRHFSLFSSTPTPCDILVTKITVFEKNKRLRTTELIEKKVSLKPTLDLKHNHLLPKELNSICHLRDAKVLVFQAST
jgi:hypothetical protein